MLIRKGTSLWIQELKSRGFRQDKGIVLNLNDLGFLHFSFRIRGKLQVYLYLARKYIVYRGRNVDLFIPMHAYLGRKYHKRCVQTRIFCLTFGYINAYCLSPFNADFLICGK